MIESAPAWVPAASLVGLMFFLMLTGLPIQYAMGFSSLVVVFVFWTRGGPLIVWSLWELMTSPSLIALPLYIFMAMCLAKSGIAEEMFLALRNWMGALPGGLATAVIVVCAIFAAMVGSPAMGTLTMGLLALPIMLRLGYNKSLSMGAIMAGGGLAALIPPSACFIIYGALLKVSVGALFAAGFIPGLVLTVIYMIYTTLRCVINPENGPPIPKDMRVSFKEKLSSSKGLILPFLLIFFVLGVIFFGIASPTESAAIGAVGGLVCVAVKKRLSLSLVRFASFQTFTTTAKMIWIMVAAYMFKSVFAAVGGVELFSDFVDSLSVGPWAFLAIVLFTYILLGTFMDEVPMLLITFPMFMPILEGFGFNMIWFGVVFMMIAEIAAMSPPLGMALYLMKSVAPKGITMQHVWNATWPYMGLQAVVLGLLLVFPPLALWFPSITGM